MQTTLITATGRVYTFYITALAEQFQRAYGGTIVTATVLDTVSTTATA